ncbi:HlyD family secretion protein [uncultured Cetobacterium sp.]|uniref:HlyD family secretion protein n=2 Tax=uncultured Cetobacterium sp. TaxID=527638 RepID=UPI00262FF8DA|nr:HlyD family secretion protein [uncultured Cetobacterium sp.]
METTNKKEATKKIFIFLGAIIFIGILYLGYYFLFADGYEETENSYIKANQTPITAQVSGVINKINIENTYAITKGNTVISIDNSNYKIALTNAKAQLGNAVRKYYILQNNVKLNEANVSTALENLNLAKKTFYRISKSFKAGITSKENYDTTHFKYLQSKNAYEQSLVNLNNSKIQAHSTNIYTHPMVSSAIENFKKSYLDLEKTKIASPISGTIAKKSVGVGQEIKPGQELFTVVDLNNIWVNANLKETQLKDVKPGNPVEIKSDLNKKIYQGIVTGISAGSGSAFSLIPAQNATGNWIKIVQRVPVRIEISKNSLIKNGTLPIGTSVTTKINTKKIEKIPTISQEQTSTLYKINYEQLDGIVKNIIKENSL